MSEKPILGLRKKFSFVARVRGVAGAAGTKVAAPPAAAAEAPDGEVRMGADPFHAAGT